MRSRGRRVRSSRSWSWWDSSACQGTCCQTWWSQFIPENAHGGFPQVVLWPPHACCGVSTFTINTFLKTKFKATLGYISSWKLPWTPRSPKDAAGKGAVQQTAAMSVELWKQPGVSEGLLMVPKAGSKSLLHAWTYWKPSEGVKPMIETEILRSQWCKREASPEPRKLKMDPKERNVFKAH